MTCLQIYEPPFNPAGQFLGRAYFLVHRARGYLLLQHVECNCNIRLSDSFDLHIFFVLVKGIPHSLHSAVRLERLCIRPNGRLYWSKFSVESNCAERNRPAGTDRFQRLVRVDGLTFDRWSYRALHFLLGPIRYVIL